MRRQQATGDRRQGCRSLRFCSLFPIPYSLLLLAALVGCGGGGGGGATRSDEVFNPPSPQISTIAEARLRAQWTVLVYLDADNDLENAGIRNFNQMEMIGSTRNVHVVVQMDRMRGNDPNNDSWTDTRRYLIIHDSDPQKMNSLRLDTTEAALDRAPPNNGGGAPGGDSANLGELNMADPRTLRDFVGWGMTEFPADHYLLIVWDHGTGWQVRSAAVEPLYRYIVVDSTSSSLLNVHDIPDALAGVEPDVIAFDACYMQELEVAYELRNSASYMVGSSAVEPSPGYNYARLLSNIPDGADPAQLSRIIVQQYAIEYPDPKANITQSAIDLSKIDNLASAMDTFARMLDAQSNTWGASLAVARVNSLDYSSTSSARYNVDLLHYAGLCANAIGAPAAPAYAGISAALADTVIASVHNTDMPDAHGLAVYAPSPVKYDPLYSQLSFARDTFWDNWLESQPQ